MPVKLEMKKEDEPNYWTRVFSTMSQGTKTAIKEKLENKKK